MILNPGEEFVVARQLNDPADVSTYYVRAYIRNAKTDALLATLNLEDKGSQRFTKTWQVASDPTGLGLYITITTKVFTDSGYSTPSTTYGVEQTELLIQDRLNPFLSPVGPDIDYKRIQKIVAEEVAKQVIPEANEVDLIPISEGLQALLQEIRGIKIPEPKEVDLRPLAAKLEALQKAVEGIEMPETDLKPVISRIEETQAMLEPHLEAVEEQVKLMTERVRKFFVADIERLAKAMGNLQDKFKKIQMVVMQEKPEPEKPQKRDVLTEYLSLDNGD